MALNDSSNSSRSRNRDSLERRMDQWFEAGRQVVDGVAGNRPGKRSKKNFGGYSNSNFDDVSRWVGQKLDWFLEDEEDWQETWESNSKPGDSSYLTNQKQPLKAISLREANQDIMKSAPKQILSSQENWVEESSLRVNRWSRQKDQIQGNPKIPTNPNDSLKLDLAIPLI